MLNISGNDSRKDGRSKSAVFYTEQGGGSEGGTKEGPGGHQKNEGRNKIQENA